MQSSNYPAILNVVCELSVRLQSVTEPWAITGSTNVFLHGSTEKPNDIDIISTRRGVAQVQGRLREFIKAPVAHRQSKMIRSFYGVCVILGIRIEMMGDVQNKIAGKWVPHTEWLRHIEKKSIATCEVPLLSMKYECQVAEMLRNDQRKKLIENLLARSD